MKKYRIDLASDTKTRPTPEMYELMMKAEVGDEQAGEDPSVNHLIDMTSTLLGQDTGLFLPSGTMCNQIALRVWCSTYGDEIITDKTSHIRNFEAGGPAANAGALIYPLDGERGIFTPDQFRQAIRPISNYNPRSAVVSLEQTSNLGGGSIWPLEYIKEITSIAKDHDIKAHLDGARLFNAVVATGISAKDYGSLFDSVWIDLSKGLGCPMGAVLCGSNDFIMKARRFKQMMGGALRQAGVVASAGIYALNNNIERLATDHNNAKLLEKGLNEISGIKVDLVETNLVFFDVSELKITANEFNARLEPYGIRVSSIGNTLLRACTHLDVSTNQVIEAIEIFKKEFS